MKRTLICILLIASIILSGCSGYLDELHGTAKPDSMITEIVPVSKSYSATQDVVLAAIKKLMKSEGVIYEIVAGEDKDTVRLKTEPIVVQKASVMDLMLAKSAYSALEIIDVSKDGTVSFMARFAKSWEGLGDQNTKNLQFPEKENELRKIFFDALDKELHIAGRTEPAINTSYQGNVAKGKGNPDQVIAKAQQKLSLLGYDPGTADGISGEKTRNAIRKFQEDNGIPVTGETDKQTMEMLLQQQGIAQDSYSTSSISSIAEPDQELPVNADSKQEDKTPSQPVPANFSPTDL